MNSLSLVRLVLSHLKKITYSILYTYTSYLLCCVFISVSQLPWEIWTEYDSHHSHSFYYGPQRQTHLSWELQTQQVLVFEPRNLNQTELINSLLSHFSDQYVSSSFPLFHRPKVNYPTYNILNVKDNQRSELMQSWSQDTYFPWAAKMEILFILIISIQISWMKIPNSL